MFDIHGNILDVGDVVYVNTTPHCGSKAKRLFIADMIGQPSENIGLFRCRENGREVRATSATTIKPLEN